MRALIVDDSAVMRSLLRSVIASDPSLEVAGTASDGASALSIVELNRPDLVLLDVEMPVMDGLATLRQLRRRGHRMPVIMCSSLTQRGAKITVEALACGASDYVAKPSGQSGREQAIQSLANDLLPKIHALTTRVQPIAPPVLRAALPIPASASTQLIAAVPSVVVLGISTGGPAALDILLSSLPTVFPLPVLIVQHMPEVFTRLLAGRLSDHCALHVCEAAEGQPVRPGCISIARGNWHMEVAAATHPGALPTLHLHQNRPENHCRPSVDVLFRSAASVYGSGVLAVVLTGMGADGLTGCHIIRNHGGTVLVQDRATSTVWGMPGAVVHAGLAHKVLPLAAIAPEIVRLAIRSQSETRVPTRAVV